MFCLLLAPGQASALRCGNKLVDIGDRAHKVFQRCGDPDFVDSYEKPIVTYSYAPGSNYNYVHGFIHVDVWTYDFGPNRFTKELIFENGVLRYINQLGYGN